jgi:hypothetical protein
MQKLGETKSLGYEKRKFCKFEQSFCFARMPARNVGNVGEGVDDIHRSSFVGVQE